ncbi:MAG: fibronectin type III domain-containing protein [Flavobacteriales bacterium]|nr:fibronectin type III domain-containing protein [Flavobacteriales bacterium]
MIGQRDDTLASRKVMMGRRGGTILRRCVSIVSSRVMMGRRRDTIVCRHVMMGRRRGTIVCRHVMMGRRRGTIVCRHVMMGRLRDTIVCRHMMMGRLRGTIVSSHVMIGRRHDTIVCRRVLMGGRRDAIVSRRVMMGRRRRPATSGAGTNSLKPLKHTRSGCRSRPPIGNTVQQKDTNMKDHFSIVRVGTKRLPAGELVTRGRNHVRLLTGNPDFAGLQHMLPELEVACEELDLANRVYEFNKGRQDLFLRDSAYEELRQNIRNLAGMVQSLSHGDASLIRSAGFEVRKKRQPSQPMPAPQNLRTLHTRYPGCIELRWNGVKNRRIYKVFMTEGDPAQLENYEMIKVTARNYFTIEHLASGSTYTFRVVATGRTG